MHLKTVDGEILLLTPLTNLDTDQPQNESVVTPEDVTKGNQADTSHQEGQYPKQRPWITLAERRQNVGGR